MLTIQISIQLVRSVSNTRCCSCLPAHLFCCYCCHKTATMPATTGKENTGRLHSFKHRGKDQEVKFAPRATTSTVSTNFSPFHFLQEMRRRRNDVTVELRKVSSTGLHTQFLNFTTLNLVLLVFVLNGVTTQLCLKLKNVLTNLVTCTRKELMLLCILILDV